MMTHLKKTFFLWISSLMLAALPVQGASSGPPAQIATDDETIRVTGARYHKDSDLGREYLRFREEIYSVPGHILSFSSKRARTTTGVTMAFKTAAKKVELVFNLQPGDEYRGAEFGLYADGELIRDFKFARKDTGPLVLTITNTSLASRSYVLTLPSWANPRFAGMTLSAGAVLEELPEDNREIYVALGDSISHGTGQGSATYRTWPWQVSQSLDFKFYSLAVGGGRVSVPAGNMLEDFDRIDLITVLVGYNDWNSGISDRQYYKNYKKLINAVRKHHPETRIVCISPLYTKRETSRNSDLTIIPFREAVVRLVKERQAMGDTNIHLLNGELVSSEGDLADIVHLSDAGALNLAAEVTTFLESLR
jgi:lysophospholipase L1-like esterase